MATAYVSFGAFAIKDAKTGAPIVNGNPTSTETVTTSGTSAATTGAAVNDGVAAIYCASAVYAVSGAAPTASATTGWYLEAGVTFHMAVAAGDKIALIDL
jgi:hypothetical protein